MCVPEQLSVFSSLTSLELRSCDLVFCAPAGLDALRPRLVSLRVLNSLEVLSHLLAPENDGRLPQGSTPLAGAATWPALERLSCPGNALGAMDASLALLPRLATLDLGRNHISSVSHLTPATALSTLRLRGNGITDCRPLANCPSLTDVDLSWNGIASLDGLQRLPALARLDLRGNRLAQLSEVATIGALPALGELLVQRNPLSCVLSWRPGVLACFPDTVCPRPPAGPAPTCPVLSATFTARVPMHLYKTCDTRSLKLGLHAASRNVRYSFLFM